MQNPQGMYPPPAQYPVYGAAHPVLQAEPGSGMAVASLVLGIISVITFFLWPVGLPVSIIGIVLGALGRRSVSRRTMATTGLVLSIVGLVLLFGVCALYGIILSTSHTNSTP